MTYELALQPTFFNRQTRKESLYQNSGAEVYLSGEFEKEELGVASNTLVSVHNTRGQLAYLTFDLDHVVEDQVRQHYERVLAHLPTLVAQPGR